MMRNLIFLYSFLFLLSGCFLDQEGSDHSSVQVKITENITGANGGAILYAINKVADTQRSFILTNNSLNLQLPKGKWDFAVVTWDGAGGGANPIFQGSVKCAVQKNVDLDSPNETVNLTFTVAGCDDDFFSPVDHRTLGTLKPLNLINCGTVPNPLTLNCDAALEGVAQSYKIKLFTKSSPTAKKPIGFINALATYINNPAASDVVSIESDCIIENVSNSVTLSQMKIPFSSDNLLVSASIEAYSDTACSSHKKSYIFPAGLRHPTGNTVALTNSNAKTSFTPTNSNVLLAYDALLISGDTIFGNIFESNTTGITKTYTITNLLSSPVTLSTITISSPASQMSIVAGTNNCTSPISAGGTCTFNVNLLPTGAWDGPLTGTLTIPVAYPTTITKTLSLTGRIVVNKFNTAPQGVSGYSTLPSRKFNSVAYSTDASNVVRKVVATDGGLSYLDGSGNWKTKTTKDGLASNVINKVIPLNTTNNLYVGTTNGFSYTSNIAATLVTFNSPELLIGKNVTDIYPTNTGLTAPRVFIATSEGFAIFDNNLFMTFSEGGVSKTFQTISGGIAKIFYFNNKIYFSDNSSYLKSYDIDFTTNPPVISNLTTYVFPASGGSTTTTAKVADLKVRSETINGVTESALYAIVSSGGSAIAGLHRFNSGTSQFDNKALFAGPVELTELILNGTQGFLIPEKASNTLRYINSSNTASTTITYALIPNTAQIAFNTVTSWTGVSINGSELLLSSSEELFISTFSASTSFTVNTPILQTYNGFRSNNINSFAHHHAGSGARVFMFGTKEGVAVKPQSNTYTTPFVKANETSDVTSTFFTNTTAFFSMINAGFISIHKIALSLLTAGSSPYNYSDITPASPIISSKVNDLFANGTHIFAATDGGGLYYADYTATTPTWSQINSGLASNKLKNVYVDSLGKIYVTYEDSNNIVTNSKITKIDLSSGSPFYSQYSISSGQIQKFYVDPNGKVYVTTDNGKVYKWPSIADLGNTPNVSTPVTSTTIINDICVRTVDGSEFIYLATNTGLYISLNGGVLWSSPRTVSHGLPTNNVKKVFVEVNTNNYHIFVITSGGGFAATDV